jgi:hypothetical protein
VVNVANKHFKLSLYDVYHYAECHYAACHYAECRGASGLGCFPITWLTDFMFGSTVSK